MAYSDFLLLFNAARAEDLGKTGDVTSRAVFDTQEASASIIAREDLRIAGLRYAIAAFNLISSTPGGNPSLTIEPLSYDGEDVKMGRRIANIHGPVFHLLQAERIALNFLAYLSGIATRTRQCVSLAASKGNTRILDTRKTLPGYRHLAKEAVLLGGGTNHRMGLYDMVMIKDNHIDAAGSIASAVRSVRNAWGNTYRVEVECRSIQEVEEALSLDIDIIMLDNMSYQACVEAVATRNTRFPESRVEFEASGDMDEAKISLYAGAGLDYISVGKLTHSVVAGNFTMKIENRSSDAERKPGVSK